MGRSQTKPNVIHPGARPPPLDTSCSRNLLAST